MRRTTNLIAFVAAALVGTTMISGTAHAQSVGEAGGYYVAVPAVAPAKPVLVTNSTPWQRAGNSYIAARAPERDAVLCDLVARNTGALASFTAGGRAFDADALAKCNARAKGGAPAASAVAVAR